MPLYGNNGVPASSGTGPFNSGLIVLRKDTGISNYYSPTADTDAARGTSLRAAVAAAATGETVYVGPGTYAIGGNRLALATSVNLWMDPGTVITSTADLLNDGCIIYPGNNSIIQGGTVQVIAGSSSGYAGCIGVVSDVGDSARTGVQVIGTTMIGDTDCFYIEHDTACSFVLRDCVFQSKWDAVIASAATTGAHTVDVYNPRIVIAGPSSIPGISRGVTSDHQATVRVFGGSVSVADGGTTYTAALATVNSGTLEAYDVKCFVSSSNTKYDVNNVSGTIRLVGCSGTASDGALITNGTITYIGQQTGVLRACAGTATPAGGSKSAVLLFGTTTGFGIYYGSGVPTISAAQGSLYIRSEGSTTETRLYSNTNGTTGWTNFTSAT